MLLDEGPLGQRAYYAAQSRGQKRFSVNHPTRRAKIGDALARPGSRPEASCMLYDLVIANGTYFDGSGAPTPGIRHVGIRDGVVTAV